MQAVFTGNESLRGYNRKRKAISFEVDHKPKTPRSHIPNLDNVNWDKEEVLAELESISENTAPNRSPVNWSDLARRHHVPCANGGQTVKEFARQSGLDVVHLDGRQEHTRQRVRKRKLIGGEVSVPCTPTVTKLKEQREAMIERGELHVGIPCATNSLTRTTVKQNKVVQEVRELKGRKIPLFHLRQKLLEQQLQFMRCETDAQLNERTHSELLEQLRKFNIEHDSECTTQQLQEKLKQVQRSRHLLFWHDQ